MGSMFKLYRWLIEDQSLLNKAIFTHWFFRQWRAARRRRTATPEWLFRQAALLMVERGYPSSMLFYFGGKEYEIFAGPYRRCPEGVFGVCLAPELTASCRHDDKVMWPDFGVPKSLDVKFAIVNVILNLHEDNMVYVGCWGGIGRTGTFLSLLTKIATDMEEPVEHVRRYYLSTAVETGEQAQFIEDFDLSGLR